MRRSILVTLLGLVLANGAACSDDCEQPAETHTGDTGGAGGDVAGELDVSGEVDDVGADLGGEEDLVPEAFRDYVESDGLGGFRVRASGIAPVDASGVEQDVNDPALVQWAVDNAVGRVTLLAEGGDFEFGDEGSVFVYTPVDASAPRELEIVGEWDEADGLPATRIVGGYRVLTVGLPPQEWAFSVTADEGWTMIEEPRPLGPARVRIASIWFDHYDSVAIWLAATDDAEIERNRFTDGITRPWEAWDNTATARGILMYTPDSLSMGDPGNNFPRLDESELPDTRGGTALTGRIAIRGNTLDGNARLDETAASGWQGSTHLLFAWYFDADLEVSDNDIRNFCIAGLGIGGFFRSVTVRDNHVEPGPVTGNIGMLLNEDGYFRGLMGAPISEGDAGLAAGIITRNTFVITGNPAAGGIAVFLLAGNTGVQVTENHIQVSGNAAAGGIRIQGYAENNRIADNTIVGDGMGAAIAISAGEVQATSNVVHGNQVEGSGLAGIVVSAAEAGDASGNVVSQNDFSDFVATGGQTVIGPYADANVFLGNLFGGGGAAAIAVQGSVDNRFLGNEHYGDYPGWSSGSGLWTFDADSADNKVIEPGPNGLDTADQLQDLGTDNALVMD